MVAHRITVGEANISIIDIGAIYLPLVDNLNVSNEEIVKHADIGDFVTQTQITAIDSRKR